MKTYMLLEKAFEEISQINNVINIMSWDLAVNMPVGSIESRANEITLLSSIVHSKVKSENISELIKETCIKPNELNNWQLANLQEMKRHSENANCIDDNLHKNYIAATTKCELIWRDARKSNDFKKLKPYLQEVLNCVREKAKAKASYLNCSRYEALIDVYDPARKLSEIKVISSSLKNKIPELLQQVLEKQSREECLLISKVEVEQQKLIAKKLVEVMGFDLSKGRLDESIHPFCGGTPFDVRLTNRYNESNFISGIMGIIHETGHGLYEQNLPLAYKDQLVGKAKGMAIHESQSLIMEMHVGRSREFCEFLSKILKDQFRFRGQEYSGENLYKLMTRVTPSLIRVDADEVTYPMHIILRAEAEELLISQDLLLDDLSNFWNIKMQEYLGICPPNDADGCMQDIHWPSGSFGYFPAYNNGTIIAAMLMNKIKEAEPNISTYIANGNLSYLNQFLDSKIRNYGSLKSTSELIKDATKEDHLNTEALLGYLKSKYLN